jgi:hypothetical protein
MREKWREKEVGGLEKPNLPKQFKKPNPEQNGYKNREDRTTTYYITNFPEEVTVVDLWNSLDNIGE